MRITIGIIDVVRGAGGVAHCTVAMHPSALRLLIKLVGVHDE